MNTFIVYSYINIYNVTIIKFPVKRKERIIKTKCNQIYQLGQKLMIVKILLTNKQTKALLVPNMKLESQNLVFANKKSTTNLLTASGSKYLF